MDKRRSMAVLLLLLVSSGSPSRTMDITRSSGLINYPEPSREPNHVGSNYYARQQAGESSKIRISLTRNISTQLNQFRAPEVSYFGAIGLGTPAKMFNVVFDTRSSETWLPYYNWFPLANNLHYSDGYSCKDSSSCRSSRREFTIDYRNTKLEGETYEDRMTLYEDMTKDDAQVLPSKTINFGHSFVGVSDAGDEQFRYKPYDGVIGLAPVAQSSSGTKNLLLSIQEQLQQNGQYVQNSANGPMEEAYNYQAGRVPFLLAFGLWFNPNQNSRHGAELTLGGVDEQRFSGELFFHKLTNWFEWQVRLTHVMLGNLVVSCSSGCYATLDTGANSVVGPQEDVESIYASLEAQYDQSSNLWMVDCPSVDQYPTLIFRIDETPYMLSPRHYIKLFKYRDTIVCHVAIKPWNQPNWLLGTSFIGAYYTMFDFANRRLGFATPRY